MELSSAQDVGRLGKTYRMPRDVAEGSDEAKRAWAIGVFMGVVDGDPFELKCVAVSEVDKVYEKLEIHERSPQMYVALNGSVAIPAAASLDACDVTFYELREGEAVVLDARVWHGGPTGIDVPATVLVVLKKGTTELDTKKSNLSPPVSLGRWC
ncbi:MAG: hypothetical protein AB1563_02680 [Bacillota bacterium]